MSQPHLKLFESFEGYIKIVMGREKSALNVYPNIHLDYVGVNNLIKHYTLPTLSHSKNFSIQNFCIQ